MAKKEQSQAQTWMPPARAGEAAAQHTPSYPSFSSAQSPQADMSTAVHLDPEGSAAQLVTALRSSGNDAQLNQFFAALRQRLEGADLTSPDNPLHERLVQLETTVEELAAKLSSAERAAAAPHEAAVARVQQLAAERPESVARQVRSAFAVENEQKDLKNAAILFVSLGEELTSQVMKYLSDAEIEDISAALTETGASAEEQLRILEDFEKELLASNWYVGGGMRFARGALERAVGPRRTQEIIGRVASKGSSGFYMLKDVAPDQIAPFISHEHPQTIALLLSQLEAAQASGILAQLPAHMQADVAYRIATLENITPNVLRQIEEVLEQSLRDILGGNQDVGGPKVVADMLNMTGSSIEKSVLDQMDAQGPKVAEAVRNLMFVFEDIAKLTDREIQTVLREVDQKDLVVALKASSEKLKDKILGNMSERVREFIAEEMEFLGPMRLSEVEEVQLRIVQQVRQLEEQGEITIVRGDSDDEFV